MEQYKNMNAGMPNQKKFGEVFKNIEKPLHNADKALLPIIFVLDEQKELINNSGHKMVTLEMLTDKELINNIEGSARILNAAIKKYKEENKYKMLPAWNYNMLLDPTEEDLLKRAILERAEILSKAPENFC